jgi:hypothetical protein
MAISYGRLNTAVRDKFGIDAIYTPAGGDPRTVKVVVDREYIVDSEIATEAFILQVVDDDVPELAVGDLFEVLAVAYTVVEVKPDFFGMTGVILNKA